MQTPIKSRMNHQWSDEKKIPLADYVIDNIDWDKTFKKDRRNSSNRLYRLFNNCIY